MSCYEPVFVNRGNTGKKVIEHLKFRREQPEISEILSFVIVLSIIGDFVASE